MDYTCFNWVQIVKKSELPSNAKYLALYLATFMNAEHDIAWPSQRRIAHETGLSRSSIVKWLDHLEDEGFLLKNSRARLVKTAGGQQKQNEYLMQIPDKVVRQMYHLMAQGGPLIGPPEPKVVRQTDIKVVRQTDINNNSINNNKTKKYNSENLPVSTRCPTAQIVELYHEILPTLPQCKKITPARAAAIRQRHIQDMESNLEVWRDYFEYIKQSPWLMGEIEPATNRKPFRATLDWICKQDNFAKIYEGRYHG